MRDAQGQLCGDHYRGQDKLRTAVNKQIAQILRLGEVQHCRGDDGGERWMRHAATLFAMAAPELIGKGKAVAAHILATTADEVAFADRRFSTPRTNRSFDFLELAQEAARWASARGADYQKDTNQSSPTQDQIRDQAVLPLAVSMDTSQLSVQVEWVDKGSNTSTDWDAATKDVKAITPQGEYVNNTVRVTVTYNWSPGILIGPLTLSSRCEVPMSE